MDDQQNPTTQPTSDQATVQMDDLLEQPSLVEQVAALQKQADEYLNGWKRAQADYQNLQKEVAVQREAYARFATRELLLKILNVHSYWQLALEHIPEEQKTLEWVKGLTQVKAELEKMLREEDIEQITSLGQLFDHEQHHAVGQEASASVPAGQVLREVRPGYKWHGEVLVPAQVIVAAELGEGDQAVGG